MVDKTILVKGLISIIVRTCSESRIFLLYQCIKSVISNDYKSIEVIIVAQTQSASFIKKIEQLIDLNKEDHVKLKLIINFSNEDQRSKNLNLGIAASKGQYLGFLDDDDIIYPFHFQTLINSLKDNSTNYAWSYADVALTICQYNKPSNNIEVLSSDYPFKKDRFSLDILFQNNFIPIHSYILDRLQISSDLLYFDENMKVTEDYAFLLNIATSYSPIYVPKVTCEYRFWSDSSNTNYHVNILLGSSYKSKLKTWNESATKIELIKLKLNPSYKSTSLVDSQTRQDFIVRYPYLYTLKYKFPQLWEIAVKAALRLNLIK